MTRIGNHHFEARTARNPATAAMLSLLPGLGQIYNGDTRKGIFFLDVAAINAALLLAIFFTQPVVDALVGLGQDLNVEPNRFVIRCLSDAHIGSPISFIVLGLVISFVGYAVRDAYDRAAFFKRRQIYPGSVIEMSEAASGSYLFHFATMMTCLVLAMFCIQPPPAPRQVTEIEFVSEQPPVKEKVRSHKRAPQNARASGPHDAAKAVRPPDAVSQPDAVSALPAPPHPVRQPLTNPPNQPQPRASGIEKVASPPVLPSPEALHLPATAPSFPPQPSPESTIARQPPAVVPQLPAAPKTVTPFLPQPAPIAARTFAPALPSDSILSRTAPPVVTPVKPSQTLAMAPPAPAMAPVTVSRAMPGAPPLPAVSLGRAIVPGSAVAPEPAMISDRPGPGVASQPVPVVGPGAARSRSTGAPSPDAPPPSRVAGGRYSSGPAVAVAPSTGGQDHGPSPGNPPANARTRERTSGETQREPDFAPYMALLQRRIKQAWFPPRVPESKRVIVVFKIARNGALLNLRMDESSGLAVADNAALRAVENAAPFPPLPEGAPEHVDILFTFDYNVFGGTSHGGLRRF